ncbi:MAG: DUF3786 domain-containing protein [Desulfobulbaceae bacterium]|jgi:hypothetical protein|nr:DUF3786 domain-containing protein [Desulfobulbaceae bacterium]
MKSWIDARYFEELALATPEQLCVGGRASHAAGLYRLRVWHDDYIVDGRNRLVSVIPAALSGAAAKPASQPGMFSLFVIWYLLHPTAIAISGVWVSEKDFPGGASFFRGPHQIPTAQISAACGNDLARFAAACRARRGEPIAMGDAAFRFAITADLVVSVVYWLGDDEFPATANLLFDQGLVGKLPLDMVFCLACEICDRLTVAAKNETCSGD